MKTKKKVDLSGVDFQTPKFTVEELIDVGSFTREQALGLVGMYYTLQKGRQSASNKLNAHARQVDYLAQEMVIETGEPPIPIIEVLKEELKRCEAQAARALKRYAESHKLSRWAMSIAGVGSVIAAGLRAHIDLKKAKHPSSVLRFAGQDPDAVWKKGERRPWNAHLKRLCYNLGDAFRKLAPSQIAAALTDRELAAEVRKIGEERGIKFTAKALAAEVERIRKRGEEKTAKLNDPSYLYVRLYLERKRREVVLNENGGLRKAAEKKLSAAICSGRKISTAQRESWESGTLTPGHLDSRARRYAVKIFLQHYYWVGKMLMGETPDRPWVFVHGGHSDEIGAPCWPMEEDVSRPRKIG